MSYEAWSGIAAVLGWVGWAASLGFLLPLAILALGAAPPLRNLSVVIIKNIERVIDALGWLAKWFALALVALVAIVVVQRYVFGVSITKIQESAIYLHAGLFMLSAGSTLLADGHVRVDLFYSKLNQRWKLLTDLIGIYLFLLPVCWLMLTMSRGYVGRSWRVMESSAETDGLPIVFLLKTLIPLTAILLAGAGLSLALRAALTVRGAPIEPHSRHAETAA